MLTWCLVEFSAAGTQMTGAEQIGQEMSSKRFSQISFLQRTKSLARGSGCPVRPLFATFLGQIKRNGMACSIDILSPDSEVIHIHPVGRPSSNDHAFKRIGNVLTPNLSNNEKVLLQALPRSNLRSL